MAFQSWQSRACRSAVFITCSATGLALASCLSVLVGVGLAKVWLEPAKVEIPVATPAAKPAETEPYSKVLYETDFLRDLANGTAFKRLKKSSNWGNRNSLGRIENPETRPAITAGANRTYRTVCVRLCDGYYFPISAATTRSRFRQDARACRSRCGSETRLFAYPTAGGKPETMTDVKGRQYASLSTAFLYRTQYDASCKCRAHPWEPDAIKAHQLYATTGWQKKAKRLARINARKFRRDRRRRRAFAGSRYVRHLPKAGQTVNVVDNSGRSVAINGSIYEREVVVRQKGRRVVRKRPRGNYMSLGVKPKRVKRPKPRYRPKRRNWRDSILNGSSD